MLWPQSDGFGLLKSYVVPGVFWNPFESCLLLAKSGEFVNL